jgi:two-component sensor histidine kinase
MVSLSYNHVSCSLDDPAGPDKYIWVATEGGGLNRLDKKTGDFFHLTAKDGLPNDVVYGILADDAGNIWGSTNKGIFCLVRPDKTDNHWQFRNFTKTDGLQDDEFNTGAYAKLENGNLAFGGVNGVHGDMINFLRYIVESFHSLAEDQHKQLHFLSDIDTLHVAYDPKKIRQVVGNLLSNALKFTPEKGNIYISVNEYAVPGQTEKIGLIIKVKDTGIGIPDDQLEHIFDRFYRSDNSHTRKAEGTGIGLALTKELVKLMDGSITVKSPPSGSNKGSEFTVALPLAKAADTGESNVITL